MKAGNSFKAAALAAAIALATGSTAVMAAAPAATQLPGQGKVLSIGTAPAATITAGTNTMDIALNSTTVIDWNKGTTVNDINPSGVAGFNIGSGATVNFTGAFGVLNLDSTGNASQIFGTLTGADNVFVANSNGIIVGAGASISSAGGDVGLISNALSPSVAADFTGGVASITYDGTGGDVTVQSGAGINGTSVLVAGGSNVNVDLGNIEAGTLFLVAGLPSGVSFGWHTTDNFITPSFTTINSNAALNLTGALPAGFSFGTTGGGLYSGGDITIGGTVDVSNAAYGATAGGALTNNGIFTWGLAGSSTVGDVVNNGTINLTGSPEIGGILTNNGQITGPENVILTHGVNNAGKIDVNIIRSTGDFTNSGEVTVTRTTAFLPLYPAAITVIGGNFSNSGQLTSASGVSITGGNFSNAGTVALGGNLYVTNGSITNNGKISGADDIETASDATDPSFVKAADYSITNAGTITSPDSLYFDANDSYNQTTAAGSRNINGSTGSFTNTGTLQVAPGQGLWLEANNDVTVGGLLQSNDGAGTIAAISATNPLSQFGIEAGSYDLDGVFTSDGVATVSAPVAVTGPNWWNNIWISGTQVKLMNDISVVDGTGKPAGFVQVNAGAQSTTDYAVRVASGKTISADQIFVDGDTDGNNPNMILQGTLSANQMFLGSGVALSDVFSGPTGGLVATGAAPRVYIAFTGRVKTAPYLNDANFRYNYLPITNAGTASLDLELLPVAYATNSTANGLGGVNVLVNGDVTLNGNVDLQFPFRIDGTGSAVTGVTNIPNTHLVVQSTGNITANGYYWPGYVYLGNIASDASGNAQPGTLGLGTITLNGDFSNVLPGSLDMGAGMHFMTQFPMTINGYVTTNANAWVNFGTELLTNAYAAGTLGDGQFFGGEQGSGSVVNYKALDESMFHTHLPDATR